jgi:hypothetical protein
VDELLRLAQAQQDVRFVLAGKLTLDTVHPGLRPLLADAVLPNLIVIPGFIDGEENLNAAIDAVDAVFIDGANYPVQSGIVCKALHFGKWIVTSDGDSWTRDIVAEYGVGIAYPSRDAPLAAEWEHWTRTEGPARSRHASADLTDPRKVADAFDAIVERLSNG